MNAYSQYMVQWLKHSASRQRIVTYQYPRHHQRGNRHDENSYPVDVYNEDQNDDRNDNQLSSENGDDVFDNEDNDFQ